VRIGTAEARGTVTAIENAVDPGQLSATEARSVAQNHVGEIEIALTRPLAADPYAINARTGRLVLDLNGRISGGGVVLSLDVDEKPRAVPSVLVHAAVTTHERAQRHEHGGAIVWLTGEEGADTTQLARATERRLFDRGGAPIVLDRLALQAGLNADLRNTPPERAEALRRLAGIAAHLAENGFIAIVAAGPASAAERARTREQSGRRFYEVHVAATREGADRGHEPSAAPDLRIDTSRHDLETDSLQIEHLLETAGVLGTERQGGEFAI
jgi:bifunctional enzyme CysN/CysC